MTHAAAARRPSRKPLPLLKLKAAALAHLHRGHPWVWDRSLLATPDGLATGMEVAVADESGSPLWHGLYEGSSPLRVRIWGTEPLTRDLLDARIERACALRERLFAEENVTGYRILNGEGDSTPGVVLDRYGTLAVLRFDGEATASLLGDLAPLLERHLTRLGIDTLLLREGDRGQAPRVTPLWGTPPVGEVRFLEHGMVMLADPMRGQKTGAFLDQRENRLRVRQMARGKRVLNLFSYSGGFSIAALLGGATQATNVDIASGAHATCGRIAHANGLSPKALQYVTSDVFVFLKGARTRKERWDLIVCDPPSLAPNEKSVPQALSSYRALHDACADLLATGGLFCAASCSSHVNAEAFLRTLEPSRGLRLLMLHGQPGDHPTTPAFMEGRYLKFAVLG